MKIIFLDIDGVLNNHAYLSAAGRCDRGIYSEIDKEKVGLLQQLVAETKAKIVLSSSWRIMLTDELVATDTMTKNLMRIFEAHDLAIFDKTIDSEERREEEILAWLSQHPETDTFVILDDDESFGWKQLKPYWVKTNYSVGFTTKELAEAIKLLNHSQNV